MSPEHPNISGLVDRASSGVSGAFARLALASQDQLLRFALAQGLTWADATDAVQETFLPAYPGRRRWHVGRRAIPCLCGIAMNFVREHRRKQHGRSVGVVEEILAASHEACPRQRPGRDEAGLDRLALALESLPPRQREAVPCRYLRRMSVRDTAAVMGCVEGTVRAAVATEHGALQVASAPAPRSLRWTIPTGIDPAVIGRLSLEIPKMTMPSRGEAGGIEWDVPTISFPPSPDWSISHDS